MHYAKPGKRRRSKIITLRPHAAGKRFSPFTRCFLLEALGLLIVTAIFAGLVLMAFYELLPDDNTAPSSPPPPHAPGPGSPQRGEGFESLAPFAGVSTGALPVACGWGFLPAPHAARRDASGAGTLPTDPDSRAGSGRVQDA